MRPGCTVAGSSAASSTPSPAVVEHGHVAGGGGERVDVELDEIERPRACPRLGRERAADVRVLLRHDDDAPPARALEAAHHLAVPRELAGQERHGERERAFGRPAAGDQQRERDGGKPVHRGLGYHLRWLGQGTVS
jgi:hypothetical protein